MRRARYFALVAAAALAAGRARADDCPAMRPTDPGGYAWMGYDGVAALSYATPGGRVRVWYAQAGPHAPDPASTQVPGVPDAAVLAGAAAEDALDGYAAMGFDAPLGDGDYPACASNGGDGLLDVYLVHFNGADGTAAAERCTESAAASRCAGFILVENDFDKGSYAGVEEGMRTVVPHEIFHLVQNAYDAGMDRWWAEGSAQWAAKAIYPELTDLERFLPAYFSDTRRSIDAPPGGVTAAFLYGTAIWPVFLGERHGPEVIREVLEQLASAEGSVMDATASVLAARGTGLSAEFLAFAGYNAGTADRAGQGGYALASTYPPVVTERLAAEIGAAVSEINSGFGIYYYEMLGGARRLVTLDSDPDRNAALAIPLAGRVAQLDQAASLPALITGDAIVVVAGQRALKTDAPFTLRIEEAPPQTEPPPAAGAAPAAPSSRDEGGCAVHAAASRARAGALLIAVVALGLVARGNGNPARHRRARLRRQDRKGEPCWSKPSIERFL